MITKKTSLTGCLLMLVTFFNTNELVSPNITPIRIDAVVRKRKLENVYPIVSQEISTPVPPVVCISSFYFKINFSTARKIRIAMASLTTPSPNRIELRVGYCPSLTMVSAATVSVAQSTDAKSKHSLGERWWTLFLENRKSLIYRIMMESTIILSSVPSIPNSVMYPKFIMKFLRFRQNPAANMIGGRMKLKNELSSKLNALSLFSYYIIG